MRTTQSNHLHFAKTWSEIEPRAGVFDLEDVAFILEQSAPLPVAFNLRPSTRDSATCRPNTGRWRGTRRT